MKISIVDIMATLSDWAEETMPEAEIHIHLPSALRRKLAAEFKAEFPDALPPQIAYVVIGCVSLTIVDASVQKHLC